MIAPQGRGSVELRQAITRQLQAAPPHRVTLPPVMEEAVRVTTQAWEGRRFLVDQRGLHEPGGAKPRPSHAGPAGDEARQQPRPNTTGSPIGSEPATRAAFARAEAVLLVTGTEAEAAQALPEIRLVLASARQSIAAAGVDVISATVHARYAWIETVTEHSVRSRRGTGASWSEGLDAVFTHKVWGWLVFAGVMGPSFSRSSAAPRCRWGGSIRDRRP